MPRETVREGQRVFRTKLDDNRRAGQSSLLARLSGWTPHMHSFLQRKQVLLLSGARFELRCSLGQAIASALGEAFYASIDDLVADAPNRGVVVVPDGDDEVIATAKLHKAGYQTSQLTVDSNLLRHT